MGFKTGPDLQRYSLVHCWFCATLHGSHRGSRELLAHFRVPEILRIASENNVDFLLPWDRKRNQQHNHLLHDDATSRAAEKIEQKLSKHSQRQHMEE